MNTIKIIISIILRAELMYYYYVKHCIRVNCCCPEINRTNLLLFSNDLLPVYQKHFRHDKIRKMEATWKQSVSNVLLMWESHPIKYNHKAYAIFENAVWRVILGRGRIEYGFWRYLFCRKLQIKATSQNNYDW